MVRYNEQDNELVADVLRRACAKVNRRPERTRRAERQRPGLRPKGRRRYRLNDDPRLSVGSKASDNAAHQLVEGDRAAVSQGRESAGERRGGGRGGRYHGRRRG